MLVAFLGTDQSHYVFFKADSKMKLSTLTHKMQPENRPIIHCEDCVTCMTTNKCFQQICEQNLDFQNTFNMGFLINETKNWVNIS